MLKSIIVAINNAFAKCLTALGRVASWPLRVIAGGGGGMAGAAPDVVEGPDADPIAAREKAMATGLLMAEIIQGYAVESFIAGVPAQLPDGLTPELKIWARGLTMDEYAAIVNADQTGISAHIQGVFTLPGVSRVGPRPTAEWSNRRPRDLPFNFELTNAASLGR